MSKTPRTEKTRVEAWNRTSSYESSKDAALKRESVAWQHSETLELELASMTAAKDLAERDAYNANARHKQDAYQAELSLAAMTAERDAWQAKFARRLQAVDELTAHRNAFERMCIKQADRAELAERQVAVLCTRLGTLVDCVRCPAKKEGCLTTCDITTAAWARAEAMKG
jgi:hypothetical protein